MCTFPVYYIYSVFFEGLLYLTVKQKDNLLFAVERANYPQSSLDELLPALEFLYFTTSTTAKAFEVIHAVGKTQLCVEPCVV